MRHAVRRTESPPTAGAPPLDIGPSGRPIHSLCALFFALTAAAYAQPAAAPWSEPPRLPSPPAISHYLFEAPGLPALIIGGVGLAVGWSLVRSDRARMGLAAGVIAVLLAAGVVLAGVLVETPRERVITRSLDLARAIGQGDGRGAGEMLAPNLYLKMGPTGGSVAGDDRDVIMRAARMFPTRVRLEAFAVPGGHAVADSATSARTRLRIRTGGDMGPSLSWWQLDWRKDPDGEWRAYTIELLLLNGESPRAGFVDEARRAVP